MTRRKLITFAVFFSGLMVTGNKSTNVRVRKEVRAVDAYDAIDRMKKVIPGFDNILFPTFNFTEVKRPRRNVSKGGGK